jgi:hypothetical protein
MTCLILIRHIYEKDLKHTKVLVFDAGEYDHHLRFHSNIITINQRQEKFANKTKKMFTRHMNKSNVQVGDYVRIKVEISTHQTVRHCLR